MMPKVSGHSSNEPARAKPPVLQAAHACFELGYIPVPVNGKAPVIRDYQKFSTEERAHPAWQEVERWFSQIHHTGFALLCGTRHERDGKHYRLLALDVDLSDVDACKEIMGSIPQSPSVKRGKKGFTSFFLVEEDMANSYALRGVYDWLAKRKVTVMPPSVHPDLEGREYEWIDAVHFGPMANGAMAAPADLPIFTEDNVLELDEMCEDHRPEMKHEARRVERDRNGAQGDPAYCSAAWINDQLAGNVVRWLPTLLDDANIPYDVLRGGKIVAVNPTRKPEKALTARKMNWHFVPEGWCGRKSGFHDHGDGSNWTPLEVVSVLATGIDIRNAGEIPDEVWELGLALVDDTLWRAVHDHTYWKRLLDDGERRWHAEEAERRRREAGAEKAQQEAAIEKRAAELRAEREASAAATVEVIDAETGEITEAPAGDAAVAGDSEASLAEILEGDESKVRDRKLDARLDVGAIGPVPQRVIDEAPGVIGMITRDLRTRNPKTPPSLFLMTGLMMVSVLASRRYEMFTPKTLSINLYSIMLGTTGVGKGEVANYLRKVWDGLENSSGERFAVAKMTPLQRFKAHEDDAYKGPKYQSYTEGFIGDDGETSQGRWGQPGFDGKSANPIKMQSVFHLLRGPSNFTGDAGFESSLYVSASRLFFMDEFGSKFGNAVNAADSNNPSWFASARELMYRTKLIPKAYGVGSTDKNPLLQEQLVDVAPNLYGVSTPQQFTRALTDRLTEDGTLNRYLIFQEVKPKAKVMGVDERKRDRFSATGDRAPIDDDILDALREILVRDLPEPGMHQDMLAPGGLSYQHALEEVIHPGISTPRHFRVELKFEGHTWQELYGTEIGDFIDHFMHRYEVEIDRAYAQDDHFTGNAMMRGAELTLRVACLAAIAEGSSNVSIENLRWAEELVRASVENLIAMTNTQMVSQRTKDEQRVLDLIRRGYREFRGLEGGRKGLDVYGEGMMSVSKLRRAFFNKKGEDLTRFNSTIRSLWQARIITEPDDKVVEGSKRPVSVTIYGEAWDEVNTEYVELHAQRRVGGGTMRCTVDTR